MSRHANSFPSRPVRLSTSFDQPKNILLNRHSNDTKSKSATLMLPSQKKIFSSRKSLSLSSSSIPEAKLHDDSLFARSSKGATKKIRAKSDATADTMSNLSLVLTQRRGDEEVSEDLPKASSMANLGLHINIKKVSTSSYSKKRHSAMPPHLIVRGTSSNIHNSNTRLKSSQTQARESRKTINVSDHFEIYKDFETRLRRSSHFLPL